MRTDGRVLDVRPSFAFFSKGMRKPQSYLQRPFVHNDKRDKGITLINFKPNLCTYTELYKIRYLFENKLNKIGNVRIM